MSFSPLPVVRVVFWGGFLVICLLCSVVYALLWYLLTMFCPFVHVSVLRVHAVSGTVCNVSGTVATYTLASMCPSVISRM